MAPRISIERTTLTIRASALGFDTAGAKAVLRVNVDDYGEVWVNGEMPRAAGRPSPATIQGFNMPNRLVLGGNVVQPGDKIRLGSNEQVVVTRVSGNVITVERGAEGWMLHDRGRGGGHGGWAITLLCAAARHRVPRGTPWARRCRCRARA